MMSVTSGIHVCIAFDPLLLRAELTNKRCGRPHPLGARDQ
jgi:hypothetical protein